MVQGTCSGAGKSLLVAGFARILSDEGVKVSPFKSQNMALNSFITEEGAEIGRAQALQAEAARIKPESDMNPILLKALGDKGCQVIINGKMHSNMSAKEYYAFRSEAWKHVVEAYERLKSWFDMILIEGVGSPAEINLKDEEIVNMRVAKHTGSPVLLAGGIERDGVFASFYGTVGLLGDDARYIKGFIVNKFRGDRDILTPGLDLIRQKTDLSLHDFRPRYRADGLKIAVVRVDYIANFTDFSPLMHEPDAEMVFTANKSDIENADIVILPGSKNSARDMMSLSRKGLDDSIRRAARKGVPVIGICGGYQMLGKRILDPMRMESGETEVKGIGLLDVETELKDKKITSQTEAETSILGRRMRLRGYEIHMGITTGDSGIFNFSRLATGETATDGSMKGNVWGTYLHGIFDNDDYGFGLHPRRFGRFRKPALEGRMNHGGNVYAVARKVGIGEDMIIDFSASINPLGMPESSIAEVLKLKGSLGNYPDPSSGAFINALSSRLAIRPECLLAGNGTTYLIYLIPRALKPHKVLIPAPPFSEYERASLAAGAKISFLRLRKKNGLRIHPEEFIRAMRGNDLAFLCNPNNPTGDVLKQEAVLEIAEAARESMCVLVIDEAFMDFVPGESMLGKSDNPYLIILRSMTKFYAMAGLRLGYGCFPAWVAKRVGKYKEPWSVNILAERVGAAALTDDDYRRKTLALMEKEKRHLEAQFGRLALNYYPSMVNFYMIETCKARDVVTSLLKMRILARDCSDFKGLGSGFIRIAVKSRKDNAMPVKGLADVLDEKVWSRCRS